jgi:hypothetical protein
MILLSVASTDCTSNLVSPPRDAGRDQTVSKDVTNDVADDGQPSSDGALKCVAGAKQCMGSVLQTCNASGQWQDEVTCPFVCSAASCTGVCVPNAKQCSGNTPQACSSSGQWASGTACPYVCSGGSCTGVCVPSSKQCSGATPQTCSASGQWQNGAACAYTCASGSCLSLPGPCQAGPLKTYITLASPLKLAAKHWNRSYLGNGQYSATATSATPTVQRYSNTVYAGKASFLREQLTDLPAGGKYQEIFMWDEVPSAANPTILYLSYASLAGDINPNGDSDPNKCTSSDLSKCDYVLPAGQEWLYNENASSVQGTDTSPAIRQWDASTIGTNQAHNYYQGGVFRASTQYRLCGQAWYRANWNKSTFTSYPDAVNTIGADIGTSGEPLAVLSPKYVYIVRQYSGCVGGDCNEPWNTCDVFEDHLYAKDANQCPFTEVMVVIGYTPRYLGGSSYGVFHVMMALNLAP